MRRVIQAEGRNSVQDGVSGISLEGRSSRGEASRKTAATRESGQSVERRRKGTFGEDLSHSGETAKGPRERR